MSTPLVQAQYGSYAAAQTEKDTAYNERVASAFGYTTEDLVSIPQNANLGVSCGNPIAMAGLKEGEVVIDMGSGAGMDVFIAARKVGPTGKVIGIDMTQEMLDLATKNALKGNYSNVEFIKSYIHSTPTLAANTANVITSNCVLNLLPPAQKPAVFTEMFRLLKPSGRVAVSDILARKPLPEDIKASAALYIGCVGGASLVEEYQAWMKDAGFEDVVIVDTKKDLNIYKEGIINVSGTDTDAGEKKKSCCKPAPKACCGAPEVTSNVAGIADYDLNEFAGAFQIYAVKPAVAA
ncbi:uncharacterized protein H6S33_003421 [Morchella sextelata]|uniref:uncharacterized protein n=1 Tax=Morchella sextelata TaxID=1174677 RepID=UPI001D051E3D|nr:uncharacterized protein H6S33_003421 [Morchella sextelata]KAH0606587.1 hypothetical protein H6S33_003421 [Morchella sextelata]